MPRITVNQTELYYEDTGGPGEPIVFSHGLLWNTTLFAPQVAAFRDRYRCISYDHRGQGQSADDAREVIDMDLLTADAVALIEALDLGPVHFCGLSMGGFVGMRLAARHPALVRTLILCDTSAEAEPAENAPKYKRLNWVARWLGPRVVIPAVMPILFGKTTMTHPVRAAQRRAWKRELGKNRRSIWRAVNGVILREPVVDELEKILVPTLVIVGNEDVATVPAKAQLIAGRIDGPTTLAVVNIAGHSATVENPAGVNARIEEFFERLPEDLAMAAAYPSVPTASLPLVPVDLAQYADVVTPLVAETVRCSPPNWTRGVLTIEMRNMYLTYMLKNDAEAGTAQISAALRQLCEDIYFRMAPAGDKWRELVLTFRRRGGEVDVDTAVRWAPTRGQPEPPPPPPPPASKKPHTVLMETLHAGMDALGRQWDQAFARIHLTVGHAEFRSVVVHGDAVADIDWGAQPQVPEVMKELAQRMSGDKLAGEKFCIVLVEVHESGSTIMYERDDPARWALWKPDTGPCAPWRPAPETDDEE